jgi:uncharacterized membrane protein SpoIIM required for sporulation
MVLQNVKSYQFRAERQKKWTQLEDMVQRAEKSGMASLSSDEIFELPHLYKGALSSLSVARSISLDKNVVDYLEALVARAYFLLHNQQRTVGAAFKNLVVYGIPAAVRSIRQEILVSVTVFMLGLIAAFFLVQQNTDWYFSFVEPSLAGDRQPAASAEELRNGLYADSDKISGLDVFATQLFTHNSRVGILAFALGFALGLPTIWLLFTNGAMLGAFMSLYYSKGLLFELGGWLIIHGSTEISAILLCGAAGLAIARHYIFPGDFSRLEALSIHGKRAALVAFGCIFMFLFSGILEGFARQLVTNDLVRYGTGIVFFTGWVWYFTFGGRGSRRNIDFSGDA